MESPKFFQFPNLPAVPAAPVAGSERYTFGPFELDIARHALLRADASVNLAPKCFELLCLLIRSHGGVLDKEHLMRALWPDTFVEEANLSNLIAVLRKALGDTPGRSQYVQTIPKIGYRFAAPVTIGRHSDAVAEIAVVEERPQTVRIIVFPFRTDPGLHDQEHVAWSLPEAIANSIAELNAFSVRSMQLALAFDPVRWDPREVATKAAVDYILAGTIGASDGGMDGGLDGRGDGSIRLTTQLIKAADGTIAWSRQWNVNAGELVSVHQAVVHMIARCLLRDARESSLSALEAAMPRDPESYNAYLLANQLSLKRTLENMSLARDLYVACVERDSSFAPAWARLGRCHRFLEKFGGMGQGTRSSQAAFERAFALSPDLVLAHSLYTPVQADLGEALGATTRLLRALEAHPNSAELYAALVHSCRYCGLLNESLAAHHRALQLDPHMRTSVAHTYFALLDFDRALFWYGAREGLYLDALALATAGREQEAAALLWSRRERFATMPAPMGSLAACLKGDRDTGIAILRGAAAAAVTEPELHYYLARQAAKFGETDLAIQLLSQSIDAGYWSPDALLRDPWLASLQTAHRFAELVEKVKRLHAKASAVFEESGGVRLLRN